MIDVTPTPANLRLYCRIHDPDFSIRRQEFEQGVVAIVDESQAIFLTAGWIHTIFALTSRFLAGVTFLILPPQGSVRSVSD